ncbi:MAG: hypothetical protein CBB87_08165 [Micavibrio sp. TMED27]|nr:hypothetical protein [Micavibrio sp.]OUT90645.1 MAG: hypothetical protein CBB87_08165 [Micavibrio sp. TMED27]|tara:strand:+ start:5211 stop:5873 length:663 start_codon:yes stop_codon:yes gene_type:complete
MGVSSQKSRKQIIAKVHIAKKQLGLCDDNYRAILYGATDKDSCKDMTLDELDLALKAMKRAGFKPKAKSTPKRAGTKKMADDEQSKKIRALWLNLYHLGAIDDPAETKLCAYAKRMSSVERLEWLTPKESNKVINGLRGWLKRLGYYHPKAEDYAFFGNQGHAEAISLINAQVGILNIDCIYTWLNQNGFYGDSLMQNMAITDLRQISEKLGSKIRNLKS